MKVEVTDHSPVKKTMTFEIEPDALQSETDAVVRDYARQARLPGFRKGKVPLSLVRSRFSKEVEEDVRERVIGKAYREATEARGLKPLGNPRLEDLTHEAGEPLRFKTTFEVLPEIELEPYQGLEARRPAARVTDDDVDTALEELRQARTSLITEENRAAATGDVIVADVKGQPEGGEPFERERMMLEIGATDNLPAFNEKLLDVTAGQSREFSVDYPEEYGSKALAGKTVRYAITVHEVKVRQVPELDDEFAKDLGDFADLAALRAEVRKDLEARQEAESDRAVRQAVLDKLLLENPVVLPEVLVEEEVRQRLEDFVRHLMQQGIDPQQADLDWKEMREQQQSGARRGVHARLLLDAVARAEKLEVSREEIDARVRADAQRMGQKFEDLRAALRKHGRMELLTDQLLREKSLDLLTSVANIQKEE